MHDMIYTGYRITQEVLSKPLKFETTNLEKYNRDTHVYMIIHTSIYIIPIYICIWKYVMHNLICKIRECNYAEKYMQNYIISLS